MSGLGMISQLFPVQVYAEKAKSKNFFSLINGQINLQAGWLKQRTGS